MTPQEARQKLEEARAEQIRQQNEIRKAQQLAEQERQKAILQKALLNQQEQKLPQYFSYAQRLKQRSQGLRAMRERQVIREQRNKLQGAIGETEKYEGKISEYQGQITEAEKKLAEREKQLSDYEKEILRVEEENKRIEEENKRVSSQGSAYNMAIELINTKLRGGRINFVDQPEEVKKIYTKLVSEDRDIRRALDSATERKQRDTLGSVPVKEIDSFKSDLLVSSKDGGIGVVTSIPAINSAITNILNLQERARNENINPDTGLPYNTLTEAKGYIESSKDYFNRLRNERGFFGAIPSFLGNELVGLKEGFENKDFRAGDKNAFVYSAETSNLARATGEIGTYFIPVVGSGILLGQGVETFATPSGRERLSEEIKTRIESGQNPYLANAVAFSTPVLNIAGGGAGLTSVWKYAKTSRANTLLEEAPTNFKELSFQRGNEGVSFIYGTRTTNPTFIDKYGYFIKPKKVTSIVQQPYYITSTGNILLEGGRGISYQRVNPKNILINEFEITGFAKETGTTPRVIGSSGSTTITRDLFGFEGSYGKIKTNLISSTELTRKFVKNNKFDIIPFNNIEYTANVKTFGKTIKKDNYYNMVTGNFVRRNKVTDTSRRTSDYFLSASKSIGDKVQGSVFLGGKPTNVKYDLMSETFTFKTPLKKSGASFGMGVTFNLPESSSSSVTFIKTGGALVKKTKTSPFSQAVVEKTTQAVIKPTNIIPSTPFTTQTTEIKPVTKTSSTTIQIENVKEETKQKQFSKTLTQPREETKTGLGEITQNKFNVKELDKNKFNELNLERIKTGLREGVKQSQNLLQRLEQQLRQRQKQKQQNKNEQSQTNQRPRNNLKPFWWSSSSSSNKKEDLFKFKIPKPTSKKVLKKSPQLRVKTEPVFRYESVYFSPEKKVWEGLTGKERTKRLKIKDMFSI